MLAEGLAERRDVLDQVVFDDERVAPDEAHQLIFFDQPAGVLDEGDEGVETARRQWNDPTVAPKPASDYVKTELAEFKPASGLDRPRHLRTLSEFFGASSSFLSHAFGTSRRNEAHSTPAKQGGLAGR